MTRRDQVQPANKPSKQAAGSGAIGKPGAVQTAPARRAPAAKEVIPLAWKLVGTSGGTPVTLLKCIERKDAEAQMARLEGEGYYKQLKIYPAEEKVPLSASLARARKKVMDRAANLSVARKAASSPVKTSPTGSAKSAANKRKTAATKGTIRVRVKAANRDKTTGKTKAGVTAPARRKKATRKTAKKSAPKKAAPKKRAKTSKPPQKVSAKTPKKKTAKSKAAAKPKRTTRRRK